MSRAIDLNADLGEGVGDDDAMLSLVSSANIACGGHAGDVDTMRRTLSIAAERGVVVGAHPGYVDPDHFGRRVVPMATAAIATMVADQVEVLRRLAADVGVEVRYVKAHGALANLAARDAEVAAAVVDAVQRIDDRLVVLAISGTEIERVARSAGAPVASEIFADRGYQPNGQLVPRSEPGALLEDPGEASERLLGFLETGLMPVIGGAPIELAADSVCVHGDSPGAVAMTQRIRAALVAAGVEPVAFASAP